MKIHKHIYIDSSIKSLRNIIKKLKTGKLLFGYEFIILINGKTEIINSVYFIQNYYKKAEYTIIGITPNKDNAIEYLRKLIELSYKKYETYDPTKCLAELNKEEMDLLFNPEKEKINE